MAALDRGRAVAVIGAGTMGAGIAQVAAQAGHRVHLFDVREGAAAQAIASVGGALERRVQAGRMAAEEAAAIAARIAPAASLAEARDAALVIEAVKEDLAVKQALFRELEGLTGPECIFATNTSSLSVTAIGAALAHPGRLVGMHFFNPAPAMALVEIVTGLATAPEVAQAALETAKAWGKSPVLARSTPGFIVNRVARPFYAEALRVLQEGGGDPPTLDAVMRESGGFRMGPFELMDLIGHDVNFAVTRSVHAAYFGEPRFTPSIIQQELVEAGRLGRKSGRGFHDYAKGAPKPAAVELAGPAPRQVVAHGALGALAPLAEALRGAGVEVLNAEADASPGRLLIDGVALVSSDGRSATERAAADGIAQLVVCDLWLDAAKATRIAIAAADQASPGACEVVAGALRLGGKSVSRLNDVPGLLVLRTVAMLANEAADAVMQGVATARDVDTAMEKGVNYPRGPLAWADALGPAFVVEVLDNLGAAYGEDRYRVSPLLRRLVARGGRVLG